MNARVWYAGSCCYIGDELQGLEYERHSYRCQPGKWHVGVTGWEMNNPAVIDDFGNLVQVPA